MAFEPVPFGKYTLYEKLAVGGMAIIYRARIQGVKGFQKDLVIKQILPQYSGMNDFIDMFIDEAKIAVNLNHANIVPVYELGEIDGQLYIAMEFVAGRDLQQILEACEERNIVVDPRIAAYILIGVCRGLDYAHNKKDEATRNPLNIIHRDISPNNVIVSLEGEVKIIDFGIAKASIKVSVTQFGTLKGKMIYMSPEQAAEGKLDHRSDVFSAGILLYELVTGKKPYGGDNFAVTQENVKKAAFPPPANVNPRLPPAMNQIITKAMARETGERFASAFEFERALSDFLFSTGQNVYARDVSTFMQELFSPEHTTVSGTVSLKDIAEKGAKVPTITNIRNLSADASNGGKPAPTPSMSSLTPTHDIPAVRAAIPGEEPQNAPSMALGELPEEGPAIEDEGATERGPAAAVAASSTASIEGESFDFEIPPPPEAKPGVKESQRDTVVTRLPTPRAAVPAKPSDAPTPPPVSTRDGVVPSVARADATRTNPSSATATTPARGTPAPGMQIPSWLDVPGPERDRPEATPVGSVVPGQETDEETAPGAVSTRETPRPAPAARPRGPTGDATPPRGTPLPPPVTRPATPAATPRGAQAPWESSAAAAAPSVVGGILNRVIGKSKGTEKTAPPTTVVETLEGFYDSPHDFLTNSYATYGDRRGLFLTTQQLDTKLGVDIPLDIQFRAPPANFRVHGRVIWRRAKEGTSKGKKLPAGLAIEFVEGIDDDLEALFAYLGLP